MHIHRHNNDYDAAITTIAVHVNVLTSIIQLDWRHELLCVYVHLTDVYVIRWRNSCHCREFTNEDICLPYGIHLYIEEEWSRKSVHARAYECNIEFFLCVCVFYILASYIVRLLLAIIIGEEFFFSLSLSFSSAAVLRNHLEREREGGYFLVYVVFFFKYQLRWFWCMGQFLWMMIIAHVKQKILLVHVRMYW